MIFGRAIRAVIFIYRHGISPLLGSNCRYEPSCSAYMDGAIRRHGAWRGLWIGGARLCRCHPWGPAGYDPIPDELPAEARWYKPWRYGRWTGQHMRFRLDRLD
jgi:putative membrane protein insertion efficiency factor